MKYTKAQKKLFVEQLRKARTLIEDNSEIYVCHAIANAPWFADIGPLIKEIDARLEGRTVYGWLDVNYPEVLNEIEEFHSMKEYRLAWIDNMIEEFSK